MNRYVTIAAIIAAFGIGTASEVAFAQRTNAARGPAGTARRGAVRTSSDLTQESLTPAVTEQGEESPNTADEAAETQTTARETLLELARPREQADNPFSHINEDNCEFHYNLCMNRICTDNKIGKCICYEDMFRNTNSTEFALVGGNRIRKGFDLFQAARRSCEHVVDQCMARRRIVTERYQTMVQRDCLRLAEIDAMKDRSLWGELQELKACARDHCTATNFGRENFHFPDLGLCFDRLYANFAIDAHCSNIIAQSRTPAALKQLFFRNMAVLREQSCARMSGRISREDERCYMTVDYGTSKDLISISKEVAVGDIMACNQEFFEVKLSQTFAYRRAQFTQGAMLAATSLRTAGAVAGMAAGPVGFVTGAIGAGIDIAAAGVDMGITAHQLAKGEISDEQATAYYISAGMNMGMSALSVATSIAGGAGAAAREVTTGATAAAGTFFTTSRVMQLGSYAINIGADAADIVMEQNLERQRREEEAQGLIQTTSFQNRAAGIGTIQSSTGMRGSCFINDEWFATEGEVLMLQWTL